MGKEFPEDGEKEKGGKCPEEEYPTNGVRTSEVEDPTFSGQTTSEGSPAVSVLMEWWYLGSWLLLEVGEV